ncbi:CLUMA_CG017406, isoform A [Clunio marinus]|uniref:CLUMA_CG017406, isoform A n=1 Tax=Clunio marinus TaxID=568069 RepID=A0A1J1IYS2_9DIPT|nr:CLUMA_CG017406, isoform A [Clunio marinus]
MLPKFMALIWEITKVSFKIVTKKAFTVKQKIKLKKLSNDNMKLLNIQEFHSVKLKLYAWFQTLKKLSANSTEV